MAVLTHACIIKELRRKLPYVKLTGPFMTWLCIERQRYDCLNKSAKYSEE